MSVMDSKLSRVTGVQGPLISRCDLASIVMSRHLRYFISELLLITNLSKSVKNFGPTVYPREAGVSVTGLPVTFWSSHTSESR